MRLLKASPTAERAEIYIRPGRESLALQAREFWRSRELLYFLVWKNLKVRYAQAILGVGWSLLQPILTASIMAFLLGRIARFPTDGAPPFLFYLTGQVVWTFFASAVTTAAGSLVAHQQLIVKVYFTRLSLPIAGVLSAMVDLIVPFLLLMVVLIVYGRFDISWEAVVALPLLLAIAAMTATGLGVGLSALNLQYRDVAHTLPFLVQTLFFASPVIYSVSQLPEKWRNVYFINPMAGVIDGMRAILLQTHPFSWGGVGVALASSIAILILGTLYFEKVEYRFADVA